MRKNLFLIPKLIISFIKYLISFYPPLSRNNAGLPVLFNILHGYRLVAISTSSQEEGGQSVLEYSLLLVVIAAIMIGFFANNFQPLKDIFNTTHNKMMERIVNKWN